MKDNKVDVSWEEDIEFSKEYKGICRFTMKVENEVTVMYFFENADNVYKVLFTGENKDNVIEDSENFCKAMDFKPFAYYDDITAVSRETTEAAESTSAQTTESAK